MEAGTATCALLPSPLLPLAAITTTIAITTIPNKANNTQLGTPPVRLPRPLLPHAVVVAVWLAVLRVWVGAAVGPGPRALVGLMALALLPLQGQLP